MDFEKLSGYNTIRTVVLVLLGISLFICSQQLDAKALAVPFWLSIAACILGLLALVAKTQIVRGPLLGAEFLAEAFGLPSLLIPKLLVLLSTVSLVAAILSLVMMLGGLNGSPFTGLLTISPFSAVFSFIKQDQVDEFLLAVKRLPMPTVADKEALLKQQIEKINQTIAITGSCILAAIVFAEFGDGGVSIAYDVLAKSSDYQQVHKAVLQYVVFFVALFVCLVTAVPRELFDSP